MYNILVQGIYENLGEGVKEMQMEIRAGRCQPLKATILQSPTTPSN